LKNSIFKIWKNSIIQKFKVLKNAKYLKIQKINFENYKNPKVLKLKVKIMKNSKNNNLKNS